ncbi:hypothetical protein F4V43_10390 [Paenibacillus spiritus]|uniref:Uncharacterized protein n=2 Tax=Paenibacillus spiritus TaxID=2496557 RepID=A0A5J5GA04_9BACL|nr:hypothetical protein F4V43_10390 [Paenibacillus spiritus]
MTMTAQLILIEGLPGSGKTTTAAFVHETLTQMGLSSRLYAEGDLNHPADYDGVSGFTEAEYAAWKKAYNPPEEEIEDRLVRQDGHYLLEYRRIREERAGAGEGGSGQEAENAWLQAAQKYDIYELPLARNRELIAAKWRRFAETARRESGVYVFECCFIQNPVTVGMIKYGAADAETQAYVAELASLIEPLKPMLIYVEQEDLNFSFRKAVADRPREWSEGFMAYYTGQGYGLRRGLRGLEGTVQVLEARRALERKILGQLNMPVHTVNNSAYDPHAHREELTGLLRRHFRQA